MKGSILHCISCSIFTLLCKRLEKWYKPDREQAGAQQGRGCVEHIVSLRMLIDYAKGKKLKLYIIYVDFSKAYDRVPRNAMIQVLKSLGCGMTMLMAIAAIYSNTHMILGAAIITTAIGVRQGSPTSCFLFTLYVNRLIRKLKLCAPDGFLGNLPCLMLMDDTVILATCRETALTKLDVLLDFCDESRMVLNETKTKFMAINGTPEDRQPLSTRDITVQNCDRYTYLGSTFTQDGKIHAAVKAHCKDKASHILKFQSFIKKNCDFPFWVKRKVLEAALLSSIFYGCESWLCKQVNEPQHLYMSAMKSLLSVRRTTPNDMCLIELGYPSATGYIRNCQGNFFRKMIANTAELVHDTFHKVCAMSKTERTSCARYIIELLEETEPKRKYEQKVKERFRNSENTKPSTYGEKMNQRLELHKVYSTTSCQVSEYKHIAFTKLRLCIHELAIERGWWSRTPRHQRLCGCG